MLKVKLDAYIAKLRDVLTAMDESGFRTLYAWNEIDGVTYHAVKGVVAKSGSDYVPPNKVGTKFHHLASIAEQIDKDFKSEKIKNKRYADVNKAMEQLQHAVGVESSLDTYLLRFADGFLTEYSAVFDLILGRFIAFRRIPDSNFVQVSPIDVMRHDQYNLVYWRNTHQKRSKYVPEARYSGLISLQGNFFMFLGSMKGGRSINLMSVRVPDVGDINFRHAIGCLYGDFGPIFCPVFMLKICTAEYAGDFTPLDERDGRFGKKSVDECLKIGLPSKEFLDFPMDFYPRRYSDEW